MHRSFLARVVPSCLLVLVLAPTSVLAQLPKPRLNSLFPAGVRGGEAVEVQLTGTDFEGVDSLWFDHPGLTAALVKGTTFKIIAAPGTPIGDHDVRAVGPLGASNPRAFVVGDRVQSQEVEPNNSSSAAGPIALNSVVNGQIQAAADVDCFAFEGKKGLRVFIDVAAERIDSRLDATLRLIGPTGVEVALNRDFHGADPFIDIILPADGRYVIEIHDEVYAGSPDHVYRLTLHDGPYLDAVLPTDSPGKASLLGRNIGGQPAPELVVDGRPLERKAIDLVAPPAGDPASLVSGFESVLSPLATRRGFSYRERRPSGWTNAVFFAEPTDPVVLEQEPNDEADRPQMVSLPCDISGTFDKLGDVDVYRFKARKGEVWWVEASAERLSSLADPVFVIQKVVDKSQPQDQANGEDIPDAGAAPRFPLASVDAVVRWPAQEDGLYQVVIHDLYNTRRGDARLNYRLNIRRERPDFRLFVVPQSAAAADSLTVRAGGRASAYVVASRIDGYAGPIRVESRDLPPGVSMDPVVIGPGQVMAPIVFSAADDAKPSAGVANLVGVGRSPESKEPADAIPTPSSSGPKLVREALSGGMVWPPTPSPTGGPPAATARLTRGFVVAVRPSVGFRLTAKPAEFVVRQGHQLNVEFAVFRHLAGVPEGMQVAASELPPNMATPPNVTIAKETTSFTYPMYVPKTVAPGTYTIVLQGTGMVPFNKDPKAKEKPNVNVTDPSNTILLTVKLAPIFHTVNTKGGAINRGGTLEVEVALERRNGFTGDVALTLIAPSAQKLSAVAVTVPAAQTTAKFTIKADADGPTGAAAEVYLRAIAAFEGGPAEVDEPLGLTVNKKP